MASLIRNICPKKGNSERQECCCSVWFVRRSAQVGKGELLEEAESIFSSGMGDFEQKVTTTIAVLVVEIEVKGILLGMSHPEKGCAKRGRIDKVSRSGSWFQRSKEKESNISCLA